MQTIAVKQRMGRQQRLIKKEKNAYEKQSNEKMKLEYTDFWGIMLAVGILFF